MTVIADVFPEIPTTKNMAKKPCFRGPFEREHGKSVEIMLQS